MLQASIINLFNRVLSDYPMARDKLKPHTGKRIDAEVGPLTTRMRVTTHGEMEPVGAGAGSSADGANPAPDVAFQIPLALLPRLARRDETAFSDIQFSGDSELASVLSTIARNVEWDVAEDLSRVLGDVAAHRVVSSASALAEWGSDARARLTANVAEYLTEEKRAFITTRELEVLALTNETLRDDIARLTARLAHLSAPSA
jgi:ubiquinone biosynthesis protein UbiJ